MKAFVLTTVAVAAFAVVGQAQCPMAQGITPQPTTISLALVIQESQSRYAGFAGEVETLAIRQQTTKVTGEVYDETLYVKGNRYRLERTQVAPERSGTTTYLFDGKSRLLITPGGQRGKTSSLETPQPYVDWSLWISDAYSVAGIGSYRDRSVLMLNASAPDQNTFSEIWLDAERLIPVVLRQDTLFDLVVTVFADHQRLEGTRFGYIPYTRELYTNGDLVETTKVLSLEVNLDLDEALFAVEGS